VFTLWLHVKQKVHKNSVFLVKTLLFVNFLFHMQPLVKPD